MYLRLFLLLFSCGASSYFLPLTKTSHLQNKAKHHNAIIDEILCLLKAENDTINENFFKPLHIKTQSCAHNNIKEFICELKKTPNCSCMKIVEKDMEALEKNCTIFKKSSSHDERCSERSKTSFPQFKESLEEFLRWVNEKQNCSNVVRSETGLYPCGNCSCPGQWEYGKGLP